MLHLLVRCCWLGSPRCACTTEGRSWVTLKRKSITVGPNYKQMKKEDLHRNSQMCPAFLGSRVKRLETPSVCQTFKGRARHLAKSRKAGDRQATAIGADALKPNVEPSRRY